MIEVTVLGCGGSAGVPVIGNNWGACDPANPRNRRSRASVFVAADGGAGRAGLLLDTSPDLRGQLLDNGIGRVDAVLWTHSHADHVHGLDELRELCRLKGCSIPAFGMKCHLDEIRARFGYCFDPLPPGAPVYRPVLDAHEISGTEPFTAAGVTVTPFLQDHTYMETLGFRIGNFAYSTDVVRLDEAAFAALEGVDLWIVDCLRETPPSPVHSHLEQTLAWIARVKPKRAVLTHMNQTMDYAATLGKLPAGVEPGYDGMRVEIPG